MPFSLPFRRVSSQVNSVDFGRVRRARFTLTFLLRAAIGVWAYAWIAGCASAPDPAAFADSTRSLRNSVQAIGQETHDQLEAGTQTNSLAAEFERQWSARNRALDAATEYSQSLVAVFAQAHPSQPGALSKSLQLLARSLGIGGAIEIISEPSPSTQAGVMLGSGVGIGIGAGVGTGVLAATADTIAFIHAQIALVQVSRTLEEALTRAQPVIERLAEWIVADAADLESIIRAVGVLRRTDLVSEFGETLAFGRSIDHRRDEIRRVSYSNLGVSELEELTRIETLRTSVARDLEPYFAGLHSIEGREAAMLGALDATRAAVKAWAAAHGQLARSIRENQAPDIAALAEAVVQLHILVARLRGN